MQVYVRIRGAPHEYEWRHGTLLRRLTDDAARLAPLGQQQQPSTDPSTSKTSKSSSDVTAATASIVEVALADGSVVRVDEAQDVLIANALPEGCESLAGVENLDALTHLHEASFVDYLQHRYDVDEVYCKSGAVLIAVNPFKDIAGLYDMHAYRARIAGSGSVATERREATGSGRSSSSDASPATALPPHVFSIAESAYRSLQQAQTLRVSGAKRDQTILVSGESGAGKTETTKFVMNYLADVSSASVDRDSDTEALRLARVGMSGSQLMSANPILESFGNARTLRNDNSSRFGKFVRMFFDSPGTTSSSSAQVALAMVGTSVDTYLLEKVRVIHQTAGERNYHVFYELLAGADASRKQALHLSELSARDFQYTRGGNCFLRNDGVQDAAQFARVRESLTALDFSDAEQTALWKAVSALLHLGNVSFIPSTDDEDETNGSAAAPCRLAPTSPSPRSPAQHLTHVAGLLGVASDAFLAALTTRKINISGECFLVNLSQAQCSDARDAMARSLYGLLFQYLVTKINANAPQQPRAGSTDDAPSQSSSPLRCIAVLDIFGFEEFDVNLFEQFCINYANEKLQFQFIHDILVTEQQAHVNEGIPWRAVEYQDNALCLEMLEQRPTGIFAMLDEECIIPKGSDAGFARKVYLHLQQHAHFSASRKEQADAAFTIHHYAGRVQYDTRGFCEKNKDQPNAELFSVLQDSRDAHLSALFRTFIDAEQQRQTAQQPKLRRRSSAISAVGIASQFKQQLAALIDVVQQTQTHYIRCIKPNDCSARNQFDALKVASQLRYGGVLKAVEIMRQSFPVRMPHAEFVAQYRVLLTRGDRQSSRSGLEDIRAFVKGLAVEQVEVGKTRVFLRQSAFDALESRRDRLRQRSVVAIQSHWKARVASRRYQRQRSLVRSLQLRWRAVQELKRRWRRRDRAAKVLQRASRQWLAYQCQVRDAAASVLQRAVRLWSRQLAARRERLAYVSGAARIAKHSSNARYVGKNDSVNDSDDDDDTEKRFGSLAGLQALPVDPTDRGSIASYSMGTSSYSEDPVDDLLDVHTRSASNASLLFEEVARAPENTMLRQALEELERLRYRAEAAEAALAQLAPATRLPLAVSTLSPGAPLGPSGFANRLERPSVLDPLAAIAVDVYGNTALHRAVAKGDVANVLALLTDDERGAAMLSAAEHQQGMAPLHVAVKSGNSEVVGLFFRPDVLPHVDVDCCDRDGNTPLHLASQLTFDVADRVMELLLSFGASANAANYLKQTPLHLCAMIKRTGASSAELMAKLLRHDADPQRLDFLKRTPLHYCVEKGMEDEATLLMRYGADPNIPDAEGVRVVTHPKATNLLRHLRVTPSWIPDADVAECMVCVEPFTFFSRKHHCDRCGRVCCSDCSSASSSWKGHFCFDCKHYQHATE